MPKTYQTTIDLTTLKADQKKAIIERGVERLKSMPRYQTLPPHEQKRLRKEARKLFQDHFRDYE